jgi:hypothetical protein
VVQRLETQAFRGTVLAIPIVNVFGFMEGSRYLPDRRDLNRSFPGSPQGSLASRLAHLFMREIVHRSTHGIDFHTASDHRTNWPQIRANLEDPATYALAMSFGAPLMMHANSRDGSLRQAARKQNIPVLLYEAGEALRWDRAAIQLGLEGTLRVMAALEMLPPTPVPLTTLPREVWKSRWLRASRGGLLNLQVNLGDRVLARQPIGMITDAFGETHFTLRTRREGLVIGHTLKPWVHQGDAIVHLADLSVQRDRAPLASSPPQADQNPPIHTNQQPQDTPFAE